MGVEVRVKKAHIIVRRDPSCKMASVFIEGRKKVPIGDGMEGNYWDFHPGCHGIHEFGDFSGPFGLMNGMRDALEKLGWKVTTSVEDNWRYTDSGYWRRR